MVQWFRASFVEHSACICLECDTHTLSSSYLNEWNKKVTGGMC